MSNSWRVLLACVCVTAVSAAAFGEVPTTAPAAAEDVPSASASFPMARSLAIIGACLGAGLAAIGGGLAIARLGGSCIESIARQPEAGGAMFAPLVVAAAMIEGGMLVAILVCLISVP